MGIQQQAVQRMIFQSLHNNRLGINIIHTKKNVFTVTVTDNTLHMYGACMVPMAATPAGGEPSAAEYDRHIMDNVLNIYQSMAKNCQTLVLCDDGCSSFKPAVREARNSAPTTAATRYMKRNVTHLRQMLLDRLHDMGVAYVHMVGRGETGRGGRIEASDDAVRLPLESFAAAMRSSESDTLMYEFVSHMRRSGCAHAVAVISKDSDIVPTAMSLAVAGVDLGDLTLGFTNPMLCRSAVNCKDLDQAIDAYGWNAALHRPRGPPRPRADFFTHGLRPEVWDLMYDCVGAQRFFAQEMESVREMVIRGSAREDVLCAFFERAFRCGLRGPVFRKIIEWTVDDPDSPVSAALRRLMEDTGDLAADFRLLLETHIAGVANDRFNVNKPSHVPMVMRCAKRYVVGDLYQGLYGDYLNALTDNRYTIFMRVHRTLLTTSCVALSALAGTDYNVSLSRLGGNKITALLGDPAFAAAADALVPENLDSWQLFGPLMSASGIGYKSAADLPLINRYLECMWRNLCYTIEVWSLRFPAPDAAHGFDGETFAGIPPKKLINACFSTAGAALRF